MTSNHSMLLWSAALTITLAACADDQSKPYFSFAGGGFVFNYRTADMYYGFVLNSVRSAPEGSVIEVSFELPQLGQHDLQRMPARPGQLRYTFRTPDLEGVKPGREYLAIVRLLDGNRELARYTRTFKTDIDMSSLPEEPLVVGPGYQPNPALPPPQ